MRRTGVAVKMIILAGLCWLIGVSWIGCGVKGPPVPPQKTLSLTPPRLSYQVTDQSVSLTWSLPEPLSGRQAKQARFIVYRSRTGFSQKPCDGCPLVFEKRATIPYVHAEADSYSTTAPLDPGYRYVFKVRVETGNGMGSDSNPVQFDHVPDVSSGGS
jgi:Fibronectin type III domain